MSSNTEQTRRDAKAAKSRVWSIWLWFIFTGPIGAVYHGTRSGVWDGFLTGCFATILGLSMTLGLDAGLVSITVAELTGAAMQTRAVDQRRKRLGVTDPRDAEDIYEQLS